MTCRCLVRAVVTATVPIVATLGCGDATSSQRAGYDPLEKTIPELQEAMKTGKTTSRELVKDYLERIEAYDRRGPQLNSIIYVNPAAIAQAEALDRERAIKGGRGPLHGIPFIVKDNYDTVDMPTTAGSLALVGSVPPDDAFQVRKLREAGAVIVGKANMHELANGITTVSSLGGQTLNPYDTSRNPGGSSGGTGAAIAANFAVFGMGSDTCGSIRIPAAHNNLVGLRGTQGLSSRDGIVPLSHTQDMGGPLTHTVTDLAIVLDATVGPDVADPTTAATAGKTPKTYTEFLRADGLQGARVGVLLPLVGDAADDQPVARVLRRAVWDLQKQGATVVEVEMSDLTSLLQGAGLINFEFKFDIDNYLKQTPNAPVRSFKEIAELGMYHAAAGGVPSAAARETLDTPEYRAAYAKRDVVRETTLKAMAANNVDVLVYPTLRRTAARIGEGQQGNNCNLSAISGLPALTVPAGFAPDGLPVGLEMIGKPYAEPDLIRFAFAFEQATHHRELPAITPRVGEQPQPRLFEVRSAAGPTSGTTSVTTTMGQLSLDRTSAVLTYTVSVFGIAPEDVLSMDLHRADGEARGPVVLMLGRQGAGRVSGTLKVTSAQARDLEEGRLYLDVHTKRGVTGEARARVKAVNGGS